MCRTITSLVIVCLLVSACASRTVPPIGAGGRPFEPDADERALWTKAEKEEETLLKKVKVYDDAMLADYLARVGDRLTPDEVRGAGGPGFKFAVLRDPTLNAFALPNGHIYVHTGLLSRLDNESQLAMIVGHEMTHVTHRHARSLELDGQARHIVDPAIAASIGVAALAGSGAQNGAGVGAAVIGQTANAILGLGLALTATAAISGYGRNLERDADHGGMDNLVRAGYDPKEAPKVFALLRSESKDRGSLETFFLGSQPKLTERIETTEALLRTRYAQAALDPTTTRDTDDFRLRMRSVGRDNALEDIRAGRFDLAQRQLDRVLAITPMDAIAHTYYGDLHRLKAQRARDVARRDEHARLALASYQTAIDLDPTAPEPHRQLGFLYYQQKDTAKAKAAFEKYLSLGPAAADARRVKEYLVELDR
jgi:beta-barrel assembly-enhancing protease